MNSVFHVQTTVNLLLPYLAFKKKKKETNTKQENNLIKYFPSLLCKCSVVCCCVSVWGKLLEVPRGRGIVFWVFVQNDWKITVTCLWTCAIQSNRSRKNRSQIYLQTTQTMVLHKSITFWKETNFLKKKKLDFWSLTKTLWKMF